MKSRLFFGTLHLGLLVTVIPAYGDQVAASLTLYNQDFAVVREQVRLELSPGENSISFSEITAHLDPQSVILRDPTGRTSVSILEQNYRNDALSQNLLLQHFEGREIDFERMVDGERIVERGLIVRAPYVMHEQGMQRYGNQYRTTQMARGGGASNMPIIEMHGTLRFSLPGTPLFPELGDTSIMKPTLHWILQTDVATREPLELSYLSGGFTWAADYNFITQTEGDQGALTGWVTMDNQSGRTFPDANIKLMAGDINRVQTQQGVVRSVVHFAAVRSSEPTVEQREFDDYHLYTLARPTTLRDRETKQVEFVRAEGIQSETLYIYNGAGIQPSFWRTWNPERIRHDQAFGTQPNTKVWIYRELKNTAQNGLGIPLPAGKVRFYRQDKTGDLEFVGENEIDHTPRDETLLIHTGNAFDLVGERVRTHFENNSSRREVVESFEIKVRNRKEKDAVTIRVVESLYRWYSWEITEHSSPYQKVNSRMIEFLTRLRPGEEKVITYTVKYTW